MTDFDRTRVHNVDFLIDRLGQDCGELQYIREFTQNSLQACQRKGDPEGHVIWTTHDVDGIRKLCILDSGDGMTGPDMRKYINQLSCSNAVQAMGQNFGLGAKIAGAVTNPVGLVYISKKPGGPYMMVWLMKNELGNYGLRRLSSGDGDDAADFYAELDPDDETWIHPLFRKYESGTQVILMGELDNQDTAKGKAGQWVVKALNTRYFELPPKITVQACEVYREGSNLRPVRGQKYALDSMSTDQGTVDLDTAKVHWWILGDKKESLSEAKQDGRKKITSPQTFQPAYHYTGHTAVIFQSELYNTMEGNTHNKVAQQFGVLMGMNRVVLYVEPDPILNQIYANTSRTQVLINGEVQLPWDEWQEAFLKKMPQELKDFVDSRDLPKNDVNNMDAVREKIQEMMSLFDLSRYKKDPKGESEVDPEDKTTNRGPQGRHSNPHPTPHPNPPKPAKPRTYIKGLRKGGERGRAVTVSDIPDVKIYRGEMVTDAGFENDTDIAMNYIPNSRQIHINGDFRVFLNLEQMYVAEFPSLPEGTVKAVVRDALDHYLRLISIEVVLGLYGLQGEFWAPSQIEDWLTKQRATTLALLPRILMSHQLKREIHRKLGRPKESTLKEAM